MPFPVSLDSTKQTLISSQICIRIDRKTLQNSSHPHFRGHLPFRLITCSVPPRNVMAILFKESPLVSGSKLSRGHLTDILSWFSFSPSLFFILFHNCVICNVGIFSYIWRTFKPGADEQSEWNEITIIRSWPHSTGPVVHHSARVIIVSAIVITYLFSRVLWRNTNLSIFSVERGYEVRCCLQSKSYPNGCIAATMAAKRKKK